MIDCCVLCKELKEIVHTDSVGLNYCDQCSAVPNLSVARAMDFLNATIPYRIGDRVVVRLGGQVLEGTGTIDDISFDLKNGGSPVYPAFHVIITDKAHKDAPDDEWATEPCLELAR